MYVSSRLSFEKSYGRKYIYSICNKMLPFKELICCWFCMVGFGCKSVSNSIWHIIHSLLHSHKCAAHSTRLRSYPRVSLCVVFTPMEISFIRNSNSYSIFCLLCINKLMPLKIIQAYFNTSQKQKIWWAYVKLWVHSQNTLLQSVKPWTKRKRRKGSGIRT